MKNHVYLFGGESRTVVIFKMERFVIIANSFQPLTIITKRSILDVAAVLDHPPLLLFHFIYYIMSIYYYFILLLTKSIFSYKPFMKLRLKLYNFVLLFSVGNADKYIFCLFDTCFFSWLQLECHNNNSYSTFPLYSHARMFRFISFPFGIVFT